MTSTPRCRRLGSSQWGTRTETKNVNSLRSVERAMRSEMIRQAAMLDAGGRIKQETRHFQETTGQTRSGRSKEEATDYRYFPEPDLVPVAPDADWVAEIRAALPELPAARRRRLRSELGLSAEELQSLVNAGAVDAFAETVAAGAPAAEARNWWLGYLAQLANAREVEVSALAITPAQVAKVIELVAAGTLSTALGRQVVDAVLETGAERRAGDRRPRPGRGVGHQRADRGGRRRDRRQPRRGREGARRQAAGRRGAGRLGDEGHPRPGRRGHRPGDPARTPRGVRTGWSMSSRKRLLFIGSGEATYRQYALQSVSRKADIVLATRSAPTWELPYCLDSMVMELDDFPAALQRLRTTPVDAVLTFDERYVELSAQLTELLAVPGPSVAAVRAVKDKSELRALLQRQNVGAVRFGVAHSIEQARDIVAEIGLPVVLKPRALGGSVGVRLVSTADQLESAFDDAASARFGIVRSRYDGVLIEEYIDGPELSVDSVVYGGVVTPMVVAEKEIGPAPYFEEIGHIVPPRPELALPAEAIEMLQRAHEIAGLDDVVTHTELRLSSRGARIIELNARQGGDFIPYLGLLAHGVDLAGAAADLALGVAPDLSRTDRGTAAVRFLYPDHDLRLHSIGWPSRSVTSPAWTPSSRCASRTGAVAAAARVPVPDGGAGLPCRHSRILPARVAGGRGRGRRLLEPTCAARWAYDGCRPVRGTRRCRCRLVENAAWPAGRRWRATLRTSPPGSASASTRAPTRPWRRCAATVRRGSAAPSCASPTGR